jgi:NADH-quinone oxidoreductase subunit J
VDQILFYLFGGVAIIASLLVIGQPNPMHSVVLLIASFGALAGLYVLLDAPFVAVTQIIIYAGAIMVLFLFVVMLLNASREDEGALISANARQLGAALAVVLGVELGWALTAARDQVEREMSSVSGIASVREIGLTLFTTYAFAFEVTSILILVAMVGALVLARRES